MRAPVLHGTRKLTFDEVPDLSAGEGEVIVEVGLCGICGSDLHLYISEMAPDGIVLGHEFGGSIVDIGPGVEGWKEGDRVVGAMLPACGTCIFCRRGQPDLCYQHYRLEAQRIGAARDTGASLGAGGYAPYARIAAPRLMRVPDSLDERQAAAVEPAAVGYHAVRNSGMSIGDTVVVLGAGPIGLFTIQCARRAGASRIVAVELVKARADAALAVGAGEVLDPRAIENLAAEVNRRFPGGPDVVFDAAGVPATLQQAVDLVKPGGYVMMVGASFDPAPVRPSAWVTRRVTVRAAFAYSRGDYAATIDLLANGGIDVGPVMSDVVPASATAEAFERLLQPNSEIKILVDPRA